MSDFTLPDSLADNLVFTVHLLDTWMDRKHYVLGGGAVLAARWRHRLSTDIGLFMSVDEYRNLANVRQEIRCALQYFADKNRISELNAFPEGYSFKTHQGLVSLVATDQFTSVPLSNDYELRTGIRAQSSEEILFQKFRWRMVNAPNYLAGDLYDVLVASMRDRYAFVTAISTLDFEERRALSYDAQSGVATAEELTEILEPAYPGLVESTELFNELVGAVLCRNVTPRQNTILQDVIGSK